MTSEQELQQLQQRIQQLENQLEMQSQTLQLTQEQQGRAKDEFLANMSHELRTPLTAILGMSKALLNGISGDLNPKQQQYLQVIHQSGKHLLDLINDLLDLSMIAAGNLHLEMAQISVQELCHCSLNQVQQQAEQKHLQLKLEIAPNLQWVIADKIRLQQVLTNLLSNAVKFTPDGGKVTLAAHQIGTEIEFSVTDTGIGITPEDQSKLFQPFVQLDSSLNRQYEGTGLGLALVKQIVTLHGGSVHLSSKFGKGSCFTVKFPCRIITD